MDNDPKFISKAVDHWAYTNRVTLDFFRLGKPTDSAFVESFNGRFREGCLNTHWFLNLDDARGKVEAWRRDFTETRPYTALVFITPAILPKSSFWLDSNPRRGDASQVFRRLLSVRRSLMSKTRNKFFARVPRTGGSDRRARHGRHDRQR